MTDHEMTMRRTKTGLLIPDHVITKEPGEQLPEPKAPEKPKSTPASVLRLNHNQRRRLGKPWRGRKMLRELAMREAAEKAKAGTLPVVKKARKSYGCALECPCRRRLPGAHGAGNGN